MYVWGRNNLGQLGDGTTTQRNFPTPINCPTTTLANADFVTSQALKVYPNPVTDWLNISFDAAIDAVAVYNLMEQEVFTQTVNAQDFKVNLAHLSSGAYMVKCTSGSQIHTFKLIKQ
jgi:hypothetical protein